MEITFGTDGWRTHQENITPDRLHMVAAAIVNVLDDQGRAGEPVAIGYDARQHANAHAKELARVVAAAGHDVKFANRDCPTPAVASAIVRHDLAGGIMMTASHNPPEYGGVKFIPGDGAPALPVVTDAIEDALGTDVTTNGDGGIQQVDVIEPHIKMVLDRLSPQLEGLTVAYDAMYGSGRGVTDAALERGGATVQRFRCTRDPTFGDGAPNPTTSRLSELIDRVNKGEVDLGIANDGDADRVAIVTEQGVVDANRLFAVMYDALLAGRSGPAVRTVSTTSLIDRIAAAHGESVIETPVGFKWVAEAMAEHDAIIGGEESGGFTIDRHIRLKDGVLIGVLAATLHQQTSIDDRWEQITDAHGAIYQRRTSVDCPPNRKPAVIEALQTQYPDRILETDIEDVSLKDGVKLYLADDRWLLIRPSGTEPKIRVYAEATTEPGVEQLLEAGHSLVARHCK